MIKDFNKYPFICDNFDNVFKYNATKNYFLKVTPWNKSEDRRYSIEEINKYLESGLFKQYKDNSRIHEIINARWNKEKREWEHNGMGFKVTILESPNDYLKAPEHTFRKTYNDAQGKEHEYFNKYRIVFFKGYLYWANTYHYYPRVIIFPFEDINKEPKWSMKTQWTNVKNLRPIFCKTTKKYI